MVLFYFIRFIDHINIKMVMPARGLSLEQLTLKTIFNLLNNQDPCLK